MSDKPKKKPATARIRGEAKKAASAAPAIKTSKLAPSIKAAVKNISTYGDTNVIDPQRESA